jgi:hypothetical protein
MIGRRFKLLLLTVAFAASAVLGTTTAASASPVSVVTGATATEKAAEKAGTSAAVHPNACAFSQIVYSTNMYWSGAQLYPCDGLYVNCWIYYWEAGLPGPIAGNPYWEWVSWTSRYGWGQQGWVSDWAIQTFNNPPYNYWNHC